MLSDEGESHVENEFHGDDKEISRKIQRSSQKGWGILKVHFQWCVLDQIEPLSLILTAWKYFLGNIFPLPPPHSFFQLPSHRFLPSEQGLGSSASLDIYCRILWIPVTFNGISYLEQALALTSHDQLTPFRPLFPESHSSAPGDILRPVLKIWSLCIKQYCLFESLHSCFYWAVSHIMLIALLFWSINPCWMSPGPKPNFSEKAEKVECKWILIFRLKEETESHICFQNIYENLKKKCPPTCRIISPFPT